MPTFCHARNLKKHKNKIRKIRRLISKNIQQIKYFITKLHEFLKKTILIFYSNNYEINNIF